MEPQSIHCDVLVMGGGPAGSATATLLARKGYKVIMIEKDHHPRFHIGESLLPLSLPYLEELGVLEDVEAIGLRKYAAEFHSVCHGRHIRFPFADAVQADYPYAFEVKRSEFDELLFRNAESQGVDTFEGWRVDEVNVEKHAISTISATGDQGQRESFKARFYIDATGRDTLLANTFDTKKKNPRHKSAAIYAHYRGASRNSGQEEGNIAVYWFDHGWFWMIPLKDGTMSVGAVLKPEYLKSRNVSLEDFMSATIALSPGVSARLKHAERISDVTGTGNYSYRSSMMHGHNFLMVGDSYAFIDPVFSSGVHLALHGASLASKTVDGALQNPKRTTSLLRLHERAISKGLDQFSWFIYRVTTPAIRDLFMNPRNEFGVRAAVVSVLAGDLFRNTPIHFSLFMFRWIYRIKAFSIRTKLTRAINP